MQQQQGEYKPLTGGDLLAGYSNAIKAFEGGDDTALGGMQAFDDQLYQLSMRGDDYAKAATKARAGFNEYFARRAKYPDQQVGPDAAPRQSAEDYRPGSLWERMTGVGPERFVDPDSRALLGGYMLDDGQLETKRRIALNGDAARMMPTLVDGESGKRYVETIEGVYEELPDLTAARDLIINALRGEPAREVNRNMPSSVGQAFASTTAVGGLVDIARRGVIAATSDLSFDDVPSEYDVETADPAFRLARLPEIATALGLEDSFMSTSAKMLKDPLVTRAIKDIMSEAIANGELDRSVLDVFGGTLGFLADFAATTKTISTIGRGAGALAGKAATAGPLAGKLPIPELMAKTGGSAANVMEGFGAGGAVRPLVARGLSTVKDFTFYELAREGLQGNIESPGDAIRAGMAGAKEGIIMLAMGQATRLARSGMFAVLEKAGLSKLGSRARSGIGAGNLPKDINAAVERAVANISAGGKESLRQGLVKAGWSSTNAQYTEHFIDASALGLMFGAYQDAVADPNYDAMNPWQKTARVMQGLTSPDALGGAAAFGLSTVIQAGAHRVKWGAEWKKAPANVQAELGTLTRQLAEQISGPSSMEGIDAYRKAFDHYRKTDPKAFNDLGFVSPWEMQIREALLSGHAQAYPAEGAAMGFPREGEASKLPAGGSLKEPRPAQKPPQTDAEMDVYAEIVARTTLDRLKIDHSAVPAGVPKETLQERRDREGVEIERALDAEFGPVGGPDPQAAVARGRSSKLVLAEGKKPIPVTYEMVEADALIPSHDARRGYKSNPGGDLNERNYADPVEGKPYRENVESIAAKPNPELLLTDSPTPTDGPPIAGPSGAVLGGNARSMALQRIYAQGGPKAEAMRKATLAAAEKFGIPAEQVQGLKNPVLIRRVSEADVGAPGELSRILNESLTTAKTANTEAISRGRKITPETAQEVADIVGDGTLREAMGDAASSRRMLESLVRSGALSQGDIVNLVDKRGIPTQSGKDVIEGALLGAVIPDVRAVSSLQPKTRQTIIGALGSMVRAKTSWPEFEQILVRAIDAVNEVAATRQPLDAAAKQKSLAEQGSEWKTDPRAIEMARRLLEDKPTDFRARMFALAEALSDATSAQGNLFAEAKRSPEQAFRESVRPGDAGATGGAPLFQTAPGFIDFPEGPRKQPIAKPGGGQRQVNFEELAKSGKTYPEVAGGTNAGLQGSMIPEAEFREPRIGQLVSQLVGKFGASLPQAEAAAALFEARASTWAKQHGKTPEEYYSKRLAGMTGDPAFGAPEGARAATTFLADGRAVLHALEKPDISSVVHEFWHVWAKDLPDLAEAPRKAIERAVGRPFENWGEKQHETFARMGERYVRSGKAPTPALRGVFDQFRSWMRDVYARLTGSGLDLKMDRGVREAFGAFFKIPALPEDVVVRRRIEMMSAADRVEIYQRNRNKSQYVGMAEMEILGHELRGGLPEVPRTPYVKAAQAGDSFHEASQILRSFEAVAANAPMESPAMRAGMLELLKGGGTLTEHFKAAGQLDALTQAVTAARRGQTQLREVMLELETADVASPRKKLSAAFEYVDARLGTDPIPESLKNELRKLDLWDAKRDRMANGAEAVMSASAQTRLDKALGGSPKEVIEARYLDAASQAHSSFAFNRNVWEIREGFIARHVKQRVLTDKMREAGLTGEWWERFVQRVGLVFGNAWSNNGNGSEQNANIKSAYMHVIGPRNVETRAYQIEAGHVLQRMAAQFGNRMPPRSHTKMFTWALESGALKKMKGPEDFEKIRPGTGYLYEAAVRTQELMSQLGQQAYRRGFLTKEQFEKWNGEYAPHFSVMAEAKENYAELSEGRIPAGFGARNMSRRSPGAPEREYRLDDPFYWLTTVASQEGKAIEYLGILQDMRGGGYAIDHATWEKLPVHDRVHYLPVAKQGNGPSGRNFEVLQNMLKQQLDPNDKRAKSAQLQEMLEAYTGKDGKPGLYLPRQTLWEFDTISTQLFNPPQMNTAFQRALTGYEQLTRMYRRGLTVGRPKHWVLNILSSIGTNHLLDHVSMWDFAQSTLTGRGYYADSARDVLGLLELAEMGSPKVKPEKWTVEKWERVQTLQDAFKQLNGSTFTGVGLESSIVGDAFQAIIEPDMLAKQWVKEAESQGLSLDTRTAIVDVARRMHHGTSNFDRTLHKAMGHPDPAERARGMQNFQSFYQLWEMFFKHAALLRTFDHQPEMGFEQAVRYAASGTADYANTSPLIRSFNTTYGTLANPLFKRTESGHARLGRAMAREMLKGRFWMYSSNMAVPKLSAVATHPMRAATVAAVMAGITVSLNHLAQTDTEEDLAWQEALRGSLQGRHLPVMDDNSIESVKRMNGGELPLPLGIGGAASLPDHDRKMLSRVWEQMLKGRSLIFQAPSRGADTRVSSLRDIAVGYGDWLQLSDSIGAAPNMGHEERARATMDWMSFRGMELSMALATGAAQLGMAGAKQDDESFFSLFRTLREGFSDALPTISPFWLLSRDGQRMMEVTTLNGQDLTEYARGIIPADARDPGAGLAELAFSTSWRSQRLMQPRMAGGEKGWMNALLAHVMPETTQLRSAEQEEQRRAQSLVHWQLSEVLSGTYDQFQDWGKYVMTYDAMLVPSLLQPDGEMARFIAQHDEATQELMTRYLHRFVKSQAWREILGPMSILAQRREMRSDYFRQAVTNAIRDPGGKALATWLNEEIKNGDAEDLGNLATLFYQAVEQPDPTSDGYIFWARSWKKLKAAGFEPRPMTDSITEALRAEGLKPELQGQKAFRDSVLQR